MSIVETVKAHLKTQRDEQAKPMSFDMKLSYAYFIPLMILFVTRAISSPRAMVALACCLGSILTAVSVWHKIRHRWRWPGVTARNILYAVLGLGWGVFFFVFASHTMLPKEPAPWKARELTSILLQTWALILKAGSIPLFTPWFLFGAGIVVLNILYALRFMALKREQFLENCRVGQPAAGCDSESRRT